VRRNQAELVRRAREEGVAVDLDELVAIARDYDDQHGRTHERRRDASRTFDEIVGSDGMLRDREGGARASTTATADAGSEGVRRRGVGARGFADGSAFANPFDDEAQALFEHELLGLQDSEVWSQDDALRQSRESTRTLSAEPLIELASTTSSNQSQYKTDEELDAEIAEAIRRSLEDVATTSATEKVPEPEAKVEEPPPSYFEASNPEMSQLHHHHHQVPDPPTSVPGSIYESFYYGPHPNLEQNFRGGSSFHSATAQPEALTSIDPMPIDEEDERDVPTPAGTMTPTEDGFSSAASLIGSGRDVGVLSDIESLIADEEHMEQRSEAGFSETYSVVGVSTPGSWTDVESVDGEEDQPHGQVHGQGH
jgi:hypothetical protein